MEFLETAKNVFYIVLPVVLTIITPVVLIIVRGLLKKIGDRNDAQLKLAVDEMITNLAIQAINYAEQFAKTESKKVGEKISGEYKLEQAIKYMINRMEEYNLPQLASEEIADRVESMLGAQTMEENTGRYNFLDEGDDDDFNIDKEFSNN